MTRFANPRAVAPQPLEHAVRQREHVAIARVERREPVLRSRTARARPRRARPTSEVPVASAATCPFAESVEPLDRVRLHARVLALRVAVLAARRQRSVVGQRAAQVREVLRPHRRPRLAHEQVAHVRPRVHRLGVAVEHGRRQRPAEAREVASTCQSCAACVCVVPTLLDHRRRAAGSPRSAPSRCTGTRRPSSRGRPCRSRRRPASTRRRHRILPGRPPVLEVLAGGLQLLAVARAGRTAARSASTRRSLTSTSGSYVAALRRALLADRDRARRACRRPTARGHRRAEKNSNFTPRFFSTR